MEKYFGNKFALKKDSSGRVCLDGMRLAKYDDDDLAREEEGIQTDNSLSDRLSMQAGMDSMIS